MLAVRMEGLGSGIVVSDTDISGRLGLKIFGYLYGAGGLGGNPGGEDEVADGLADGGVADGLALADGGAIGEDLADGVALEEDLEDIGVDGELSSSSSELVAHLEVFSKRELSLTPATASQSTALLRSQMTLARK